MFRLCAHAVLAAVSLPALCASCRGLTHVPCCMQIVTAGMLVVAMRKPLPARSNVAGWVVPVKAEIPTADAVKRFLLYAGPICGVLAIKTVLYSEACSSCIALISEALTAVCSSYGLGSTMSCQALHKC